jgi:predicted DNA-binding transcriptional regulator AlpA
MAGPGATLTVEVLPALVGVAEAAAILGWDKRRIFTYISRRSFPEPVALLASGRVWRREDIESYASGRTKAAAR